MMGPPCCSLRIICFHTLHLRLWETVHPEGTLSPPTWVFFSSPSFFPLFLRFPVPGRQTSNLQQNSPLCLHSPAFSKYSHSSNASSFLIFSILYLFILKRSFVAAHTDLGKCGGQPSSPGRPGAPGSVFHCSSLGVLAGNRTHCWVPTDQTTEPALQWQTDPLRIRVLAGAASHNLGEICTPPAPSFVSHSCAFEPEPPQTEGRAQGAQTAGISPGPGCPVAAVPRRLWASATITR